MAQVIDLKTQYADSITQIIKEYDQRLTIGFYRLKKFRIYYNPVRHKLTAYLDCEEGKFYSVSTLLIDELKSGIGNLINKIVAEGNIVKIEVIYAMLKSNKAAGLTINVGQK